jgi:hypothetical protein
VFIGYQPQTPTGRYTITWAITSSGGGAVFLTDQAYLTDGRSGAGTSMRWSTGTQNTSSTVTLTGTIHDPVDAVSRQGIVGVINVLGLPVGTKIVVNGVTQRTVATVRGEAVAWFLPGLNNNAVQITIYNDVNGVASIAADAEFFIGEIFVGRVVSLCSLAAGTPTMTPTDPTAVARTASGSAWALMRRAFKTWTMRLGLFSKNDLYGGSRSSISAGSNPASTIDIETLAFLIATTGVCAICPLPQDVGARGDYDQDFMQQSWMLARPSAIGGVAIDKYPKGSWNPTFQEAR